MAEKLKSLEILERPYLHNRLTDFYRTKTKLNCEASSVIICGKGSQRNHFEFSCDMPSAILQFTYLWFELIATAYVKWLVVMNNEPPTRMPRTSDERENNESCVI